MFLMLRQFLSLAADTVAPPLLQTWRAQLLERVLRSLCLIGLVALVFGTTTVFQHTAATHPVQAALAIIAYLVAYGVLLLITAMRHVTFAVRAGVVLCLLIGVGIVDVLQFGLSGDGRLFFFAAVVLAAVLFTSRPLFALTLGFVPLALLGGLLSTGLVRISPALQANAGRPLAWISSIAVFALLIITVIMPMIALLADLSQRLGQVSTLLDQAQVAQANLEAEVAARTAALMASETRYRTFTEMTSDYVYAMEVDPAGQMQRLWITDTFTRICGYTPDELTARGGWASLIHPADLATAVARRAVLLRNQDDVREFRIIAKDGSIHWLRDSARPVWDEQGQRVVQILGAAQDVTARRAIEAQLHLRDRAIAATNTGIVITDAQQPDNPVIDCNVAFEQMSGYSRAEIIGRNCRFLQTSTTDLEALQVIRTAVTAQQSCRVVLVNQRKDGTPFWNELSISPVHDEEGQLTHFIGIQVDVTDRIASEQALREEEARLQSIVGSAMDAIITVDRDGYITLFNAAAEQLLGCPASAALGQSIDRFIPLPQRKAHMAHLASFATTGVTKRALGTQLPLLALHTSGAEVPIEASLSTVVVAGQQLFTVIVRDITARLRAEAALRASEERFQTFMDYTPASAWITTVEGVVRYMNATYLRMFAIQTSEPINASIFTLFPAAIAQPLLENIQLVAQRQTMLEAIETAPRPDGTMGEFLVYKFPLPVQGDEQLVGGIAVDITERIRTEATRRELERKLLETQKLESLGVLAGGIAHDFNNLLVAMLGNAELALLDMDAQHPAWSSVKQLQRASQQAAELTNQLLAYSGKGRFVVAPLDINALMLEMTTLLRVSVPKAVTIEQHLAPDLPLIDADSTQIRQVLMNLVINAAEAITGAGTVRISSALRTVDRDAFAEYVIAPETVLSHYVAIEIADTGYGMDRETKAKIFDPFFTTKFTGRGLGLAAVLGIIRGHGGAIAIASAVGQGTTATVLFPTSSTQPTLVSSPTATDGEALSLPAVGTTLLLIDDELEVRQVISRMLRRFGYTVLEAADGQAGLTLFEQHAASIGGVLLDLTMPQMGGVAVVQRLRVLHPELPIVVMSGYSEMDMHAQFANTAPDGFLQKPFTPTALQQMFQRVLRA